MTDLAAKPLPLPVDVDAVLRGIEAATEDGATPRARDLAQQLGVPEAALAEARRRTGTVRRLDPGEGGFANIIKRMGEAGEVMALTRNHAAVHEKHGAYGELQTFGQQGLMLGEIDLRIFFSAWKFGYLLEDQTRSGPRRSFQFFDDAGEAIHKIYETQTTDQAAFSRLIADFEAPEAEPAAFLPPPPRAEVRPDEEIDVTALRAAWRELTDVHQFFGMLRDHKVDRAQAMRLAGEDLTRRVSPQAARKALERASGAGQPIMIFAANRGMVQIHTGAVNNIKVMGPWANVLDPRFNLHLREDEIAEAWIVRKPGDSGMLHSLELYDAQGICILQLFGERHEGEPEREDWRALVEGLLADCAEQPA